MRHYKRKTSMGMTPEAHMRIALKEITIKNVTLNAAAERYSIPKTTLHRYLKKIQNEEDIENIQTGYSKRLQIFTNEQEKLLENYIKCAADIYFGLAQQDIRSLAYDCAIVYGLTVPDSWHHNRMAGPDWLSGFMGRHSSLSVRVPEATSLSRTTSFNKTNVNEFFTKLAEVIDRHNFKSHQIYNVDETGVTTVQKPRRIIAAKGTKQVGAMTSGERGTLVTTCLAVSASGNMIPPMLIFPGKNFKEHFIRDGPGGCVGCANKSGWMTGDHFLEFLKHFVVHTRPSAERPVLLLLDNHHSHVYVPALNYAKQNGIVMLSFPPHCSHKLQPLDRSVFGPLKRFAHAEQDKWMRNNPGKPMTIYDLPSILQTALPKAATQLNITRGFVVTGISPYNPDVFTDFDYAPSSVTDRPEPKSLSENVSDEQGIADSENCVANDGWTLISRYLEEKNLALVDVPKDGHCLLHAVHASLKQTHGKNLSTSEIIVKLAEEFENNAEFYSRFSVDGQNIQTEIQRYITHKEYSNNTGDMVLSALNSALAMKTTIVQVDGNQTVRSIEIGPGRSDVHLTKSITLAYHGEHYQAVQNIIISTNEEKIIGSSKVERAFLPESVRPFPKAGERKQKTTKRKRKSAILTDTPEKARFELEQAKGHTKRLFKTYSSSTENKENKKKKKKTMKRRNLHDSDSDTAGEDCCCLVCLEPYSNSKSRERWIQCTQCKNWAHEDCVDAGPMFVCLHCDSDDSDYVH